MPRDPMAQELEANIPGLFAQKAKAYGAASVADLSDSEHKAVGDEVLLELAKTTKLPDWIAKVQAEGITDADLMELATGSYDMAPADAIAKLRSDTIRAFGRDASKTNTSPYGNPY